MRIVFSDAEYWSKDICIVDSKFVKVGETE